MAESKVIYRIVFVQHEKVYELYARYLTEETLIGFIEIEDIIFSNQDSKIVIDPSEEKLRQEFKDVKRFYVPMHQVLRIDEVRQEGVARIRENDDKSNNVHHLPRSTNTPHFERE